jgi:plasmid rolling circle replication initiator protein Rep
MKEGSSPQGDPSHLTVISPKDKPWDLFRAQADIVRGHYLNSELPQYGQRMKQCSEWLGFVAEAKDGEECKLRLRRARFCRVRHCPVCQWRRSLVWRARFFQAIPNILEDHPKARWVFLTLTVRNCPLTELKSTVGEMNKAWKRLTLRKQFPAIGFIRTLEVTRQKENDYAHPHFHVVMMVPPSYFSGQAYLSQNRWMELWKSCLQVDYLPTVDVKAVKGGKSIKESVSLGVLEVMNYTTKGADLIYSPQWLEELTIQLHRTRAVGLGGLLKEYLKEDEPEDLINTDEEDESLSEVDSETLIYFGWRENIKRYTQGRKWDSE